MWNTYVPVNVQPGLNKTHYTIDGNPIPLARARHGKGRTWDSQKQVKFACGLQLKSQNFNQELFNCPLALDVTFFLPIPHRLPKRKKDLCHHSPHATIPDLSNLIKFIEDVATGILYKDDALIATITAKKVYSSVPRTELSLTKLTTIADV